MAEPPGRGAAAHRKAAAAARPRWSGGSRARPGAGPQGAVSPRRGAMAGAPARTRLGAPGPPAPPRLLPGLRLRRARRPGRRRRRGGGGPRAAAYDAPPPRATRARPGLPGPRARPAPRLPGTAGDSPNGYYPAHGLARPRGPGSRKACTKPTARPTTMTGAKPGRGGALGPHAPHAHAPSGRSRTGRGATSLPPAQHGGGRPGKAQEDQPDDPDSGGESPGPGHTGVSRKTSLGSDGAPPTQPRSPTTTAGGAFEADKPHSQKFELTQPFWRTLGKWKFQKKKHF